MKGLIGWSYSHYFSITRKLDEIYRMKSDRGGDQPMVREKNLKAPELRLYI